MSITSMNARMGMAEKLDIPQLTKAVQDGTVPSFIGIPLIQQKMKEAQQAKSMAMPKAPPVAQQIMQQAEAMQAPQGIPALPSQMPEEYAQGGILSYADGGDVYDDEDYDPEDEAQAYALSQGSELMDEYLSDPNMYAPAVYEKKSAPGIESLREVKVSPSGKNFESKEAKVEVGDGTSSKLLKHILHKESRGQRYDKEGNLLTSSKGAMGEMQVMPATARDPGFGIAPARSNDPEELRRVGEEYANVLLKKYRDPKLAAIAYNMGPGNTDKWLAAGADMSKLPQETRGYIQGMAGGGEVHGYAGPNGSLVNDDDFTSIEGFESGTPLADARRKFAEKVPKKKGFKNPPVKTGDLSQEAIDRLEAQDLTGINGLQAGTRYADAMAAIPKAPPQISKLPTGNAGITYAPNAGMGNVTPTRYTAPEVPEGRESEMMRAIKTPFRAIGSGLASLYGNNPGMPSGADYTASGDLAGAIMGERTPTILNQQTPAETARLLRQNASARGTPIGQVAMPQASPSAPSVSRMPDTSSDNIDAGGGQNFGATQAAAQAAPTEQAAQANPISGIEELLNKREAGLGRQKDIDNYMSLLSAGLGMMGGTSPFAAANIGQGAQAGVKTFADAQARRVAEENAILSGRLGAFKYAGDKERAAELMALRKQMADANLGLGKERLAQSVKEHEAGRVAKTEAKQLDYINRAEEKALTAATKLVADNPNSLSMTDAQKADSIKAMTDRLLMANKNYRVFHQGYYGADPFPNMSNTMSSDRAAQFKVERQ